MCTNTPGSFECACNPGYQLAMDGTSCEGTPVNVKYNTHFNDCSITTDVDECASNTDTCPQVCSNTEGSYTCSTCGSGLQPNSNGTMCEGMYIYPCILVCVCVCEGMLACAYICILCIYMCAFMHVCIHECT